MPPSPPLGHVDISGSSSAVGSSPTDRATPVNMDSEKHAGPSEEKGDMSEGSSESKEAMNDSMTENMIRELVEGKRKQLDDEIAVFKAAKDEEFRIFERELRQGRGAGRTKKSERGDAETFNSGKKRHRGGGYTISSSPSRNTDTQPSHYSNELKDLRTHYHPGDQTPQTPPHERELEFQGLFTPSFMPLLDCGGHRSLARATLERPARPSSPESSPSSHLKQGGSAALAQQSFTRPALPKLTLPNKPRPSSLPSAKPPQQPSTPTSRRSDSSTSLHSSIRHSSDDHKPRPPKQVKFKFDDIIVLPTASYDRSQEPMAITSDDEKQTVKQELSSDVEKGVPQADVKSTKSAQKMFSTSPLSEPSPSRSSNFENLTSESSSSGLRDTTHRQQASQMEGNGSLDGLGGKWSTIKERDAIRGVQDESAEVIARAEYEEADEDDYDDGGLFDFDETVPDLPELRKSKDEETENGNGIALHKQNEKTISPIGVPLIDPGSFRGYDLSLVIPTTIRSTAGRYGSSLSQARPNVVAGSAPADIGFEKMRLENTHRVKSGTDKSSNSHSHGLLGDFGDESSIAWGSMRRRSVAKYDVGEPADGNGLPTKSKRHLWRNGATIPEERGDGDEDAAVSPMACSLPVQIPASPLMGYTDSGDMDSNSYTPKAPSSKTEKQSVTPKNTKETRNGQEGDKQKTDKRRVAKQKAAATSPGSSSPGSNDSGSLAVRAKNEPTATNVFSLSTSANISSVDNPITDQFATATIGGLHRNAYDPDSLDSCSSSPITRNQFMGNPFIGGSYASPTATAIAKEMGDIGSYVGSIDGCSGYDPADNSSYLKLRRGRNGGEPASFGERLMLEDETKAKTARDVKEKRAARRATQP
ncbi:hypothetical protein FGG08_001003 [Glutinoglossum americanum]|uniref:Uncharacterized protein n=1 Tax=Glutinoglossum americanum TaxID=1670608 RepID=A0A9P8ICD8_9PEZI|nr:hypothetical protein FGG08_001003 [Glutinoglossum americanum]